MIVFLSCSHIICITVFFFFSSRRRHTRSKRDWSSDVCSSDLVHRSTLVVALAAGALLLGIVAGPALAVGGSEFVSLTNVERASVGLGPVSLSSPVAQI